MHFTLSTRVAYLSRSVSRKLLDNLRSDQGESWPGDRPEKAATQPFTSHASTTPSLVSLPEILALFRMVQLINTARRVTYSQRMDLFSSAYGL
jgi:hypothetical protein